MSFFPILFVRHGQTAWNRAARLQGHQDIPLNALGKLQAARNGRAVSALLRGNLSWEIMASPLDRTRETMTIALAAAGMPSETFSTDARLREVSYGAWEGLTLPEVAGRDPAGHEGRERDKWGFAPPEGESYAMLDARVGEWLSERAGPTFVVAHGGVLRVLLHRLAGVPNLEAPHAEAPQDRAFLFTGRLVAAI